MTRKRSAIITMTYALPSERSLQTELNLPQALDVVSQLRCFFKLKIACLLVHFCLELFDLTNDRLWAQINRRCRAA